ncbi:Hypothetical protein R9X50_00424600 [Acrodontium crateriforme]|uniref:DUF7702 domain-containing protein n=1 Tax=Acrodontium crateriforme TaxID=150365 RepID=A0AAQ3R4W7_9PEZI|nr:Hypothetical protein R9X50_00424600 [Acrodontium crateriforme]
MWSHLSSLAVAIIVFYTPALFLSFPLIIRHGRPRLVWFLNFIMAALRIGTSVVLFLRDKNPSDARFQTPSLTLLSVGVFPLLLSAIGFIRVIRELELPKSRSMVLCIVVLRLIFLVGIALLIVGAILRSPTHPTGIFENMVRASSIVSLGLLLAIAAIQVFIGTRLNELSSSTKTIMTAFVATGHLLLLRILYFILSAFNAHAPTFSPLSSTPGSVAALVCMSLIPEYMVVAINIYVGWKLPRVTRAQGPSVDWLGRDRKV